MSPAHAGVDRNTSTGPPVPRGQGRPLTRAWIETRSSAWTRSASARRPLTRAWIETAARRLLLGRVVSPAHAGVDRNVCWTVAAAGKPVARSRGRGSKRVGDPQAGGEAAVARSRGRGSKLVGLRAARGGLVSPAHAGVDRNADELAAAVGRSRSPAHAGVDRNGAWSREVDLAGTVARSRGRGSKRHRGVLGRPDATSPAHAGVDRNSSRRGWPHVSGRRPLTRAWIETRFGSEVRILRPGRPLTRAWIETSSSARRWCRRARRPLTRAWIETPRTGPGPRRRSSRPLTRAWIETRRHWRPVGAHSVARSRGRGSKPGNGGPAGPPGVVARSRGRGSKPRPGATPFGSAPGRPLTRAWIETLCGPRGPDGHRRRPLTRAWIETTPAARR